MESFQLQREQLAHSQNLVDTTMHILNVVLNNITFLDYGHMRQTSEVIHKVLAESAVTAEEILNRIDALESQQWSVAEAMKVKLGHAVVPPSAHASEGRGWGGQGCIGRGGGIPPVQALYAPIIPQCAGLETNRRLGRGVD